jgi:branched-subunit amino acid ABC-type transport system permease component
MVAAASTKSGIRERAIEEDERDAAIFGVDA